MSGQLLPRKTAPRLGLGFGLGLVLELGSGGKFLGGQLLQNHIFKFSREPSDQKSSVSICFQTLTQAPVSLCFILFYSFFFILVSMYLCWFSLY